MNFKEKIRPFFWSEYKGSFSFCLDVGSYKNEIFETRSSEGFEGNGYNWEALASVFLNEKMPELKEDIHFDPEASMFCAYSKNKRAMEKFALGFKEACENDVLIKDLFSRAELD
ncbi:MAG: immunity 51 family protein [Spirochaetaceae bacterium]|jgi:hypothetical protein|nr:immunity 51 family protein [Spirochaetaceae bacterium]